MNLDRRTFLQLAAASVAPTISARGEGPASADFDGALGVLVDLPECIGCRKCEFACQEADGAHPPPIEAFDDKSVLKVHRRLDPLHLTVINEHANPVASGKPIFVKRNCLHCNDPACASACLVGAITKKENGAVIYDPWKCMGCRYCMVACPFQVPTYEYGDALTPRVRKCSMCFDRINQPGGVPACVKICPRECLTFGKRGELLTLARRKIAEHPDQYVDHIYGEKEVGGTSWMYLSSVPFESLGFASIGDVPPHALTRTLQHSVFKHWVPPLVLYGLLGVIMRMTGRGDPSKAEVADERPA